RARGHNRRLVLGQLQGGAHLGRAEIARRTGLTTQAVSNIVDALETEGFLRAAGTASGRRGLPAVQYALAPGGGHALGIEIRPGAVLATLVDLSGAVLWEARDALDRADPDMVAARATALKDAALSATRPARLMGAGAVMPGPFGRTEISGAAADLPGWEDVDAPALFADALGCETVVENDANAAASAERMAMAAEGIETFACLYFGTGLGLAIVQDGRAVTGAFGNAGEIGQVPLPDGRPLEAALSRLSVERHLAAADVAAPDTDSLAALHAAAHPALDAWLDGAAAALTHALAIIESLLDPRRTVLCGALPETVMRDLVARTALPRTVARRPDNPGPALAIGTCSRMAAARGAAALVLARAFTSAFAA
ncbi:MAG: ROK family transcriptional regulator, partial [Pseudomonadota bacterium]